MQIVTVSNLQEFIFLRKFKEYNHIMKVAILTILILVSSLLILPKSLNNKENGNVDQNSEIIKKIKINKDIFSTNPNNYELAIEIGDGFLDIGSYQESEQYFKKAQNIKPTEVDPHLKLAFLYRYQNLFEESENEFEKAIELDPKNDSAYGYGLGYLYRDMGDLKTAEMYFLKAFKIKQSDFNYGALGDIYREEKRYEESEKMFKKSIEINPLGEDYGGLGWLYFDQGRYTEAEEQFKNYLSIVRPKGEIYNALSQVLYAQGKYKEAEIANKKAITLSPKTIYFYDLMANIYESQDKDSAVWANSVRRKLAEKTIE